MIFLHIAQQHLLLWFSVKCVKSGHVTQLFFQLGGSPASHLSVFDFPSMTAPLQEEISADAPNCSWHGSPEYCLEMLGGLTIAVDRQCQNRKKVEGNHTDKNTYSSTHPCRKTIQHIPTDTHRHTIFATLITILVLCICVCVMQEDVGPGWQLSGLLWFQCLDTLPNEPIICSGVVLWWGPAWPQGDELGRSPWD